MRDYTLRIRLTDSERASLEAIAAQRGQSLSAYARKLIFHGESADIITDLRNASKVLDAVEIYVDRLVEAAKAGDASQIAAALKPFGE